MSQRKRKFDETKDDDKFDESECEQSFGEPMKPGVGEGEGRIPPFSLQDSDSDDDLPYVSLTPSGDEDLAVGSLVWVKWKRMPHWPALVLKLYHNHLLKVKRVKIAFIEYDSDQLEGTKCITRPFIIGYKPTRVTSLAKDCHKHVTEGLQSKEKKEFCIAWRRVESYLFWSDIATRPCVWEFFGIEDVNQGAASDTESVREDATADDKEASSDVTEDQSVGCGDSSSFLDDSTADPNDTTDRLTDMSAADDLDSAEDDVTLDPRYEEQWKRSQLLIDYMNSANGRKRIMLRLRGIERGHIKSGFKEKFDRKDKSRSDKFMLRSQGFGPICNFDQVYEMFQICRKYYSELNKRSSKKELIVGHQSYLMEVIMPEVIVSCITSVEKVNRLMAEKAFYDGPPLDCDDC